MTMKQLAFEDVVALLDDDKAFRGSAVPLFERWLKRGDGIAVYRNMAMDSANFGFRKFVSFGSTAAQLETDAPPQRLPDIGSEINWAYQLEAVCR